MLLKYNHTMPSVVRVNQPKRFSNILGHLRLDVMSNFNNMETYVYIAHTQFTRNSTETQELTSVYNLRQNNLGTS